MIRPPEGRPAVGGGRRLGNKKSLKGSKFKLPPIPKMGGPKPPSASAPKPTPSLGPKPPTAEEIAAGQLGPIYDPVLGQYATLIQQRQSESAAQAKAKADAFRAFAEWYQAHAPQQVQDLYSKAGGNQSAFAKGFSDGFTASMRDLASTSNQQLSLIGAPEGQKIHVGPESGGDVIYGLGGAIPSGMLNQQGAAFAAAASLQSPAIFAEGQRQAGEITAAANKDIEALRLEETKLKSQYAAAVQEQVDKLRAAGEKAKADQLEALQKRADKRTDQTGTIWVVKGNGIKDTGRPTLAGLKYGQDVKMDLARLKKDADYSARMWETLDWKMKNDLIRNKQAAIRIFQAQKRLGLTAQNQKFNQWYKQQTLAISAARENRLGQPEAPEPGMIDPETGQRLTPTQIKGYKDDAIVTMNSARSKGLKPFEIMEDLYRSPIPFEIWGPIAARRWGINPQAKNLKGMAYNKLFRLAAFWGLNPDQLPSQGEGDVGASRAELIAWINQARSSYTKASAAATGGVELASYGGNKTDWLSSLWVQAGGDPAVAGIAAAIALAESGGRVDAWNPNGKDRSAGLWQINYYGAMGPARTRQFGSPELLRRDPLANAKAAVAIYKSAGNSFSPWSTYTSGLYKDKLGGSSGKYVSSKSGGKPVREMFYDPLGAYDEGSWIAPIGGHSNHVHISFGDPNEALLIMRKARQLGLRVGENPYYDKVDPVHTDGSYHYQLFSGLYSGRKLGRAADFSGSASAMAALFKWVRQMYLGNQTRGTV